MGDVSEEDAVLDHYGKGRQPAIGLVQTTTRLSIELPAVQRALEARALVVHAAALVRANIRQQHEPGRLLHQKIRATPFADNGGEPVKRVDRA